MNASPAPTVSTTSTIERRHPHRARRTHRERAALAHRHRDDRRTEREPRARRSAPVSRFGSIHRRSSSLALTTSARSSSRSIRARAESASSISAGRTLGSNVSGRREVVGVEQRGGGQATGFEHRRDRPGVHDQGRRRPRAYRTAASRCRRRTSPTPLRIERGAAQSACASASWLPETSCTPDASDVVGDPPSAGVGTDVGEEVDSRPSRASPTATLSGLPPTCSPVTWPSRSTMSISASPITSALTVLTLPALGRGPRLIPWTYAGIGGPAMTG